MSKFIPHDYQKYAIKKILQLEASGLFLDMGLGKTVCALTASQELLYNRFEVAKVLVIAPLRVARDTWPAEIKKWDHLKNIKYSTVLGSRAKREEALKKKAGIYIINRENVSWLVDYYKSKWPFDMVVIDELSSFKATTAKRWRDLKKVRPLIKKIVGLTGTPAPNSLIDLWPQMYLLDRGERLGQTITYFRHEYFIPGRRKGYVVYDWIPKKDTKKRIYKKIGDICVSMKSEDYLKMPEKTYNFIEVNLKDKLKTYKQLEKDLLLPFKEGGDVVADNAASLSTKLLQMASGAVYDENQEVKKIHDEKIKALEDVVEASNGKPLLVFYWYKHDLQRLKENFKDARTLEDSKDIEDWNKGKIDMLLAHPASAGHGLNLQSGGSTIVWFSLTWSLELYQQANARLYRQGQKDHVIIHHLVAKGTIDENVKKALDNKRLNQESLLEAVKARIKELVA